MKERREVGERGDRGERGEEGGRKIEEGEGGAGETRKRDETGKLRSWEAWNPPGHRPRLGF